MNEFVIAFRETLEAALIVGIIYTLVDKQGWHSQKPRIWIAIVAAIIASIGIGAMLNTGMERVQNEALEKLLEALFMYLTAALLFYVVFWMSKTVSSRRKLESDAHSAMAQGGKWGLMLLVFFAVLREGFETALFLLAGSDMTGGFSYTGFFGGIALASFIGFLIIVRGRKVNLRPFFLYTSLALVLFAAGMVAYGTHEFEEYQVISGQLDKASIVRPWDILQPGTEVPTGPSWMYREDSGKYYHLLHDKGNVGVYLKGFLGYNSNPNRVELALWLIALIFGLWIWRKSYFSSTEPTANTPPEDKPKQISKPVG